MTTVAILAGGLSHERDISLRSGRRVSDALRSTGFDVVVHDVDQGLIPALQELKPDIVWPLLHGTTGEDGSFPEVFELLGLPYIGANPSASRLSWSKPVAKTIVSRTAGIATPDAVSFPHNLFRDLGAGNMVDQIVEHLGLPLVVKPTEGGSALGVSYVERAEDLPQAMVNCFAYGPLALVEKAIIGIEVAVSIVDLGSGPVALPPVEIVTDSGTYDFDARYNPGRTEYFAPARLSDEITHRTITAALEAHKVLGLRHVSRVDLIIESATEVPVFLEVNVAPGMTETSLLPQAAIAAGYDLGELYGQIISAALRG